MVGRNHVGNTGALAFVYLLRNMARNESQSKNFKIETSESLDKLFYKYTHLPLGGKEIVCPYWINNLKAGVFGPYGGKGTPREIVEATKSEAEKIGLDLSKLSKEEILAFMKSKRIGMDCSGFVFWMLDALDREKGGDGIANDILSGDRLLPSRANVATLTNEGAVSAVELKDVRVGDMIRLDKGKHVAIVMRVVRDLGDMGEVREVEYAHSSARTKILGVHAEKIKIKDQTRGLEKQQWNEIAYEGKNYGETYCLSLAGDGLKRLKTWV